MQEERAKKLFKSEILNKEMKKEEMLTINFKKVAFRTMGIIIFIILIFGSFYIISAGQRGVILTFGKPSESAIGEGLHFKLPIIQRIVKMDVKTLKYEADLTAASKDLQDVNTRVAINYRILSERVPEIYRTIGLNYQDIVIYPLEQETNKGITAKYTAEELITKREEVREKMRNDLKDKLDSRGIIVEEVSIIDFKFSEIFTQAIENKVTAEQDALAAKNKLAQVEYEAKQRIVQATAEAEAIRIQAQAVQSQGGEDYVRLQAIQKWDGVLPQFTGGGAIPFIDFSTLTRSGGAN